MPHQYSLGQFLPLHLGHGHTAEQPRPGGDLKGRNRLRSAHSPGYPGRGRHPPERPARAGGVIPGRDDPTCTDSHRSSQPLCRPCPLPGRFRRCQRPEIRQTRHGNRRCRRSQSLDVISNQPLLAGSFQ
jgi:hypothetical protein